VGDALFPAGDSVLQRGLVACVSSCGTMQPGEGGFGLSTSRGDGLLTFSCIGSRLVGSRDTQDVQHGHDREVTGLVDLSGFDLPQCRQRDASARRELFLRQLRALALGAELRRQFRSLRRVPAVSPLLSPWPDCHFSLEVIY
jgi:hypothetical protein